MRRTFGIWTGAKLASLKMSKVRFHYSQPPGGLVYPLCTSHGKDCQKGSLTVFQTFQQFACVVSEHIPLA